jgi:hypothetical protein
METRKFNNRFKSCNWNSKFLKEFDLNWNNIISDSRIEDGRGFSEVQ